MEIEAEREHVRDFLLTDSLPRCLGWARLEPGTLGPSWQAPPAASWHGCVWGYPAVSHLPPPLVLE